MGRISKLHEYALNKINSKFSYLHVQENYYPEWLVSPNGTRLELDIYIGEMNIAAEIQGDQHSRFIPFFHVTQENFEKQKEYDAHKEYMCRLNGVRLYDIATEKDVDIMIYEIKEIIEKIDGTKPKYFYQEQGDKEKTTRKTKKTIIQNVFSGLKEKLRKKNNAEEIEKRLMRAIENIKKYEAGELQANKEKYLFWKDIVERQGIIDIEQEYKRSIEKETLKRIGEP